MPGTNRSADLFQEFGGLALTLQHRTLLGETQEYALWIYCTYEHYSKNVDVWARGERASGRSPTYGGSVWGATPRSIALAPAAERQAYSGREGVGGQIGEAQAGAASGCGDALGQAELHGPLLGLHDQGGHPGVAGARGVLEGFSHWITWAATNVGAAIRKQPLQGLRLTLALAMAHEHLIRCDKACYQGCAAAGTHVSQTLLGAFDAAGWRQQNRGFLATETEQAYLVALLIGVEWTLLCFPGACRLGLCRVRRPPGLGLLSLCPQGLTFNSTASVCRILRAPGVRQRGAVEHHARRIAREAICQTCLA